MRDYYIEKYLGVKHRSLDTKILDKIESKLNRAQSEQCEGKADYYWFLKQTFLVQKMFVHAFDLLTKEEYEKAWNEFDQADIALGYLEYNTPSYMDKKAFNLDFIGDMIKEYQKIFPYNYFFSRETIIKKEKCNICGQLISIRNSCGHIPGKVYMGKLCLREVVDLDFKAIALVTDPFDKYAMLHLDGKEYNYGMIKYLLEVIKSPFDEFHIIIEKRKKDAFKKIGRNMPCPCGSGKKYKKCHLDTDDENYDHYIVCVQNYKSKKRLETKFFYTWEEQNAE